MNKDILYLFPQSYPFKGGDQVFINNELQVLSNYFSKVFIIHFSKMETETISTTENVEVLCLPNSLKVNNFIVFFHLALYELLFSEFKRLKFKLFIKYFKFIVATYKKNWTNLLLLVKYNLLNNKALYYSFWMNDQALMLSLALRKKLISKFIFRLHGFDLYEELRPDFYIPFRDFNFKYVTKAFTVSQYGYNYLIPKLQDPEKLAINYLGNKDIGFNPFSKERFVLVSCSSLRINNRVTLIADSLARIKDLNIHWFHFGGDGDFKLCYFESYTKDRIPSNIQYHQKGQVRNEELMYFYQTQPISAFIHLSASEGGPSISCVEAISFGIPIVGSTAGGLRESVTKNTGLPLSENPTVDEVADGIRKVLTNNYQNKKFRKGVKDFAMKYFNSSKNAQDFFSNLP